MPEQDTQTSEQETQTAANSLLTVQQVRVLACLMEKHLATPKNYPLTLNSLMLACNQKTNRGLVMDLSEGQVGHTAGELESLDYVRMEYGDRAKKISHRAPAMFQVDRQGQAVLAMLMLREPLTLADIKARTERLAEFDDLEHIQLVVDDLIEREQPLLVLIPKSTGRREDRYTHLLSGPPDLAKLESNKSKQKTSDAQRIVELESRVAELEQEIAALRRAT